MDLSIIILSYNSKFDLERLLPSVYASDGNINYEVIVVDNGSKDGSADYVQAVIDNQPFDLSAPRLSSGHLPRPGESNIVLLRNSNNGFAHGNNLGVKIAKGKYLLILNPDTRLEKDTLKTMLQFMEEHPDVGISTCKVLLPNGKLDLACRRRFPNPWNSFLRLLGISKTDYNMLDTNENESQEIDACMGAFMMCRRLPLLRQGFGGQATTPVAEPINQHATGQVNCQLPTFDQDFFMYGEDLDLCWRVKEAGFKVWYFPATFITHYKGSSSRKTPFKALKWFHDAMWVFYKKHYAAKYWFVLNWIVWVGIYLRLAMLIVINSLKKEPKVSG